MGMKQVLLAASVAALGAVPVIAADGTPEPELPRAGGDNCLQNNRLWSWNAANNRTLNITDRTNRRFTLRLAGGCVGLTTLINEIEIRSFSNQLSCVRRGDFVRFVEPSLGRMSCTIISVERLPDRPG